MAARFTPSKRFDILIQAASALGFKLELAGDGETLETCKHLAMGYPGDVVFLGKLSTTQLRDWLQDLDIYLHASEGETFSMAILQAMATGKYIIASKISGMEEILGAGPVSGVLVDNDQNAWTKAIQAILTNPQQISPLGRKARAKAVSQYDYRNMLASYLQLISSISSGNI